MELIREAVETGARLKPACEILEISARTFNRWARGKTRDGRKGAKRSVKRALSHDERKAIIATCGSPRFRDMTPYEINAILLEEGIYLASPSTIYRVLREADLLRHRLESRRGTTHARPDELKATGPDQVWCWDITYLRTTVKGLFLYAYVVLDIWDRRIVGWAVHGEESDEHAADLMLRLAEGRDVTFVRLHSDNGVAMKGSTMLFTLYHLGVIPSFSRPRVSDDNPYIESLFKTMKYKASYPRRFNDLAEARYWLANFVDWYNREHRHSGIGYVTPIQRHERKDVQLFSKRNETLDRAYQERPYRFSRAPKPWVSKSVVYLNRAIQKTV